MNTPILSTQIASNNSNDLVYKKGIGKRMFLESLPINNPNGPIANRTFYIKAVILYDILCIILHNNVCMWCAPIDGKNKQQISIICSLISYYYFRIHNNRCQPYKFIQYI